MGGINRKRIYISRAARVINGRPLGRIHKVKGGLLRAYIPLPFLSLSFLLLPRSLVTRNLAVRIPRDVGLHLAVIVDILSHIFRIYRPICHAIGDFSVLHVGFFSSREATLQNRVFFIACVWNELHE